MQPGSTVVTSLTPFEAKQKHCFVIEFHQNNQRPNVIPIPLLTPRQVYYEEIDMTLLKLIPPCENVRLEVAMEVNLFGISAVFFIFKDEKYFIERVDALLQRAADEHNGLQPRLPLIRIKMIYSDLWEKIPVCHYFSTRLKLKF